MTILERLADLYGISVEECKTLLQSSEGCVILGLDPKAPLGEQIAKLLG